MSTIADLFRRLGLRRSECIDVRDFGAKPNSDSDCTVALQRALDAAADAGPEGLYTYPGTMLGGHKVYVPRGVYHVSSKAGEYALRLRQRVILEGDGDGTTIVHHGEGGLLLWQADTHGGVTSGMRGQIRDIRFCGTGPSGPAITMKAVWNASMNHVTIYGWFPDGTDRKEPAFEPGILIDGLNGFNTALVSMNQCAIQGVRGDGIRIVGDQTVGVSLQSCIIQNVRGWGLLSAVPYATTPERDGSWAAVSVKDCDIEGNGQGGIGGNFWGSTIEGCHFESQLQGPHLGAIGNAAWKGVTVRGNRFFTHLRGGDFSDPKAYSVYLACWGPTVATFEGNMFYNCPRAHMYVDPSRMEFRANQFEAMADQQYENPEIRSPAILGFIK